MDHFSETIILNGPVRCIDEDFNKEWESNIYIQAYIRALKWIHENQDGDNKGQGYERKID